MIKTYILYVCTIPIIYLTISVLLDIYKQNKYLSSLSLSFMISWYLLLIINIVYILYLYLI